MSWTTVLAFDTRGYPVALNNVSVASLPSVQGSAHSFLHNDGLGNWSWETIDAAWITGLVTGGHIIQDEGTPLTARANINFVGAGVAATDNAGADSTDVTIPGGAGGITDITYADLATAIGGSTLTPGSLYRITDYATIHYIVDGNGTRYGDTNTGTTEPLIVLATDVNKIDKQAYSTTYPQDIIFYDWNPANWTSDLSFADAEATNTIITGFAGVIYFRHDTILDNYMGYDFRAFKFRRWKSLPATWDGVTAYSRGNFVLDGTDIYCALRTVVAAQAQIDTLTLTGTSGTADITDDIGTQTVTFNTDLATTAADYVTANEAAYLAGGIVLTSSGDDLIFTASVAGAPFTSPTIVNTAGDLDGTIANTQANTPPTTLSAEAFWAKVIDLTVSEYQNAAPTSWLGITSDSTYDDFYTFSENGAGTYALCCKGNRFELSRDIFIGGKKSAIPTPSIAKNNVFFLSSSTGLQVFYNTLGANFYNNTAFVFSQNSIGANSYSNIFSTGFQNNTVGRDFYSNVIGYTFSSNLVGNGFLSNNVGVQFVSNTIGGSFTNNIVGNVFWGNSIGNGFNANSIGGTCQLNSFGNYCYSNVMMDQFNYNEVGNYFHSNTVGSNFQYNRSGNLFNTNIIGSGFTSNDMGNTFATNTIGDDFTYNQVKDGFYANTVGNRASRNSFGGNFNASIIADDFYGNAIADSISLDFSVATYAYGAYNKEIYLRPDSTAKLRFYDDTDSLVIVGATD